MSKISNKNNSFNNESEKERKNMITQAKPIEERVKIRYNRRNCNPKPNVQNFRDFGKYAAEQVNTIDYEDITNNIRIMKKSNNPIKYLNDILFKGINHYEAEAFWDAYTSTLNEDFRDIFDKLVKYLDDNQRDCNLYIDSILEDYIEELKEGDNRSLATYLTDIVGDALDEMVSTIVGYSEGCYIDDLIEDLTDEDIEKCKLLHKLTDYNVGRYYIDYLLEQGTINYFLNQLIKN